MQKGVPQIMDITCIRSVLHYLTKNILPSKFETAQQPEPNTIQLCFRGVDSQTWLEVSWNGDSLVVAEIESQIFLSLPNIFLTTVPLPTPLGPVRIISFF